jgi:hypothetical protein
LIYTLLCSPQQSGQVNRGINTKNLALEKHRTHRASRTLFLIITLDKRSRRNQTLCILQQRRGRPFCGKV